MLETIVGGKEFRIDPGETCIAVEASDAAAFMLLNPTTSVPVSLTEAGVVPALGRLDESLQQFDDANRRAAAASQNEFWKMRHDFARQWATQQPLPSLPQTPSAQDVPTNPIDAFLAAKTHSAVTASAETLIADARTFHDNVLPILRDHCFRCHGEIVNGGLLLNSREAAIRSGDSESSALVPGNADESELVRRIHSLDPVEKMPPGGGGLNVEQIATLETWIKDGLTWPAPPVTEQDITPPSILTILLITARNNEISIRWQLCSNKNQSPFL